MNSDTATMVLPTATPGVTHSSVDITAHAPVGIERLLETIVFGTSGLRYQRRHVTEHLTRFNDPVYIALRKADTLAGVYVLDKRQLVCCNYPVQGIYRGLLSVATEYQGGGIGKQLGLAASNWIEDYASREERPVLSYGFVEADNTRSQNLLKGLGNQMLSEQVAYLDYRQNPRSEIALLSLTEIDLSLESMALELTHADCHFRDITDSRSAGYAVLDQEGLRVSARVMPVEIAAQTLGRVADWMVRLLVMPFAPARKRFDPQSFRYLKLTNIVVRPGCEADWKPFVSSLLHQFDLHFASIQLDAGCALLTRLQRHQAFTRWLRPAEQRVIVVGQPVGELALQRFGNVRGPHQLSAVDF